MSSRGLGDDIERITKFTGIKKAVDVVSNKLNKDFYDSKLTAIKHNFLEAQKYISLGDQIWEAGLKDLVI